MRFVWAVVAFFLAAVCIGGGIAQRTVFMGPKTVQAEITVDGELPYLLIDGAVLSKMPGAQTLMARGDGPVFASYGRTADMTAWLSDASYEHVVLKNGKIVTEQVAPTTAAAAGATGRDPAGSDLWLDQFQEQGALIAPLKLPATMSVLVASDGTAPAPADVTLTWPIENATPWVGPLLVLGGLLLLLGVVLWILGIRHVRRSRGPRRKGLPPLPQTEPIDIAVEAADKGVISAGPATPAVGAGRRAFAVVPAVAVSALLFAGCSADTWPQFGGSATASPSASASVIVPEDQQQPAVTKTQAERIIASISATVAEADSKKDAEIAGTRLEGAALAERQTNYMLQAKVKGREGLPAIPAKPVAYLVPEQSDGWPRIVMATVYDKSDATVAPTIMFLSQQDPWSAYKATYLANLEASAELPGVAPAEIGAIQVQPDSPFLLIAPDKLAAAYADVLDKGDASQYAGLFDPANDSFRVGVANDRKSRLADFNKTGAKTASLAFQSTTGTQTPLALATLESGAIVAVNLYENDLTKPTKKGAVIKLSDKDSPTVKALTGVSESATGFTTTWGDQLFFYVPGQGSTEKIRLVGYASNILSAKVNKK